MRASAKQRWRIKGQSHGAPGSPIRSWSLISDRIYYETKLSAEGVIFLVALPLCLGVALASNAPLFSGILAGIIGGLLVGAVSRSHTSVSGPAAGLTAVVAAQIASLGSFEAFLLAVVLMLGTMFIQ